MGTIAETLLTEGKAGIKFGSVPAARAAEVHAADAATLDRWLAALVVADTLEDIFQNRTGF